MAGAGVVETKTSLFTPCVEGGIEDSALARWRLDGVRAIYPGTGVEASTLSKRCAGCLPLPFCCWKNCCCGAGWNDGTGLFITSLKTSKDVHSSALCVAPKSISSMSDSSSSSRRGASLLCADSGAGAGVLRAEGNRRLLNRFEDGTRGLGAGVAAGARAGDRALVGDAGR